MWSTFGEFSYKEMLSDLKLALRPNGLFVIDIAHFFTIPTGAAHKTYTNKINDVTVHTEIDETYRGKNRTREIVNVVNGESFKDRNEMDTLCANSPSQNTGR